MLKYHPVSYVRHVPAITTALIQMSFLSTKTLLTTLFRNSSGHVLL